MAEDTKVYAVVDGAVQTVAICSSREIADKLIEDNEPNDFEVHEFTLDARGYV